MYFNATSEKKIIINDVKIPAIIFKQRTKLKCVTAVINKQKIHTQLNLQNFTNLQFPLPTITDLQNRIKSQVEGQKKKF